jgi:hypothetical protein
MAHVTHGHGEEVLPSLPGTARSQLLDAFSKPLDEAEL